MLHLHNRSWKKNLCHIRERSGKFYQQSSVRKVFSLRIVKGTTLLKTILKQIGTVEA